MVYTNTRQCEIKHAIECCAIGVVTNGTTATLAGPDASRRSKSDPIGSRLAHMLMSYRTQNPLGNKKNKPINLMHSAERVLAMRHAVWQVASLNEEPPSSAAIDCKSFVDYRL